GFIDSDYDRQRFIVFRSLTLLRMLALDPSIVDAEHADVPSSKLAALMDRLDDVIAEGHRSIVFSQFTSFLDQVAADLDRLSLPELPYVCLMHPGSNPAADNQAIDRAHRIEQTKAVMVYRYVAEGTIEQKVLALQRRKAELFDSLMSEAGTFEGRGPSGQAF